MTEPNETAFPIYQDGVRCSEGLTKREYFASMAMQGLLITEEGQSALPEIVASWSVEQADALIKALNK